MQASETRESFIMYAYDFDGLNTSLKNILRENLTPDAWAWLEQAGKSVGSNGDISKFNIAFVAAPRRTGKNVIRMTASLEKELQSRRKGLNLNGWTVDRLARVWLLMQLDPRDKEKYHATIENLFLNAEMGELVALYSSLPLLAYPESWARRCAEGIRSNIGQVLEAVICNNPLPGEQLDEAAWNQLVLKAIFTEKPVLEINGLLERRNMNLARSLSDYAHERWAAHREVNPLLWICVGPYIGDHNFSDIQRLFSSGEQKEREAAALACYESKFEGAKRLLEESGMKGDVEKGKITWQGIAAR